MHLKWASDLEFFNSVGSWFHLWDTMYESDFLKMSRDGFGRYKFLLYEERKIRSLISDERVKELLI